MKEFEINQKTVNIKYIPNNKDWIPWRLSQYTCLKSESFQYADEYIKKLKKIDKFSFFKKLYYKYFKKGFIKGFINGIDILREIYVQEEVSQERLERFLRFLVKENLCVSKDPMGRIMIVDAEKPGKYFTKYISIINKNESYWE